MGLSNQPRMAGSPAATRARLAGTGWRTYHLPAMRNRLPACLLVLALLGGGDCLGQENAKTPERAPSVIPAPRPEPVVPPSPAKTIAQQLNDAFVNVFERVAPAVVVIDVIKKPMADGENSDYFPDFFYRQGPGDSTAPDANSPHRAKPQSEGSGFIIQSSGYILTNNHVVAGAEKINVRLKDGRQFSAKLTGVDDKSDIAVVKIDATDLPTAELADSDSVRVGEIACAIGVPYNLDYSFTTGVVSAKGRNKLDPQANNDSYEDYIQTDASINPGNSGGPLVNLDGKVIGMNTLINGLNRGLGFAIPSNMLREVGDQLIHVGRMVRPYIGVRITSIGEDTAEHYGTIFNGVKKGVIVDTILSDTPASKSDLRQADVITEVDGVAVGSDRDLQKQILGKKIGAAVQLTVFRKGKFIKVPITTGELPSTVAQTSIGEAGENPEGESTRADANKLYGMQLQELTKDLAVGVGVSTMTGVLVTTVAHDSPAALAGIKAKDVITAVDDKPVKDPTGFKDAAKGADVKRGVLCYLERPTGKTFVVIKTE